MEAAIYVTKIILLKFFNLFNLNSQLQNRLDEIPWIPDISNNYSNPAILPIPPTQNPTAAQQSNEIVLDLYRTILQFPSVCFTQTQVSENALLFSLQEKVNPILFKIRRSASTRN